MSAEPATIETLAAATSRYEIVRSDVEKAQAAATQARDAADKKDLILADAKRQLVDAEARVRQLAKTLA